MPTFRRKRSSGVKLRKGGGSAIKRSGGKPMHKARKTTADIGELVRKRAEAERAVAEARRSHARLRGAIDIMPEGVVFLDEDGRYILWNKKYAEIYHASADLFQPGIKLEDTLRAGVARGEYPEAVGREEEWIVERLQRLHHPEGRHEQKLNDGRVILIEERLTGDGGVIGLRVDITELKQREASFRLLFDGNPVPMIVCATGDERILAVNDAAVAHYGYDRAAFECMSVRSLQAFESESPWVKQQTDDERVAQAWKHVKADGSLIDVAIYSRELVHEGHAAMLLALIDITERRQAEARLASWLSMTA
jgi:PAS domain S-box-containing protein